MGALSGNEEGDAGSRCGPGGRVPEAGVRPGPTVSGLVVRAEEQPHDSTSSEGGEEVVHDAPPATMSTWVRAIQLP